MGYFQSRLFRDINYFQSSLFWDLNYFQSRLFGDLNLAYIAGPTTSHKQQAMLSTYDQTKKRSRHENSQTVCNILEYCVSQNEYGHYDSINAFLNKYPDHNITLPAPEFGFPQEDLMDWHILYYCHEEYERSKRAKLEDREEGEEMQPEEVEEEQKIIDEMTREIEAKIRQEQELFILSTADEVIAEFEQIITEFEQIIAKFEKIIAEF